jgi:uncharacterized protein (DUF1015 family)
MAEVKPFQGVLYNIEKIGDLSSVICPPYDVISPSEQDFYYDLSDYNIVRVELGKHFPDDNDKNNSYTRARDHLEAWLNQGILIRDNYPNYYIYLQEFTYDGKIYQRPGIVLAVRLEDYENRIIIPHEKTLPKAKEDRLNLLRATHTNVSQIFGFFSDKTRRALLAVNETIKEEDPVYSGVDKTGVRHSLYRIPQKFFTDISEAFLDAQIFIADGHHRYETALNFRNEMRRQFGLIDNAWYEYVMMTVVPVELDLLVLPYHRIARLPENLTEKELFNKLKERFEVRSLPGSHHLKDHLEKEAAKCAFGVVTNSNSFIVIIPEEEIEKVRNVEFEPLRKLVTNVLSELVLKPIFGINEDEIETKLSFTSDYRKAVEMPKENSSLVSFVVNPISVDTIREIALNGYTMPQKSTYFYPKLWTGLVMRSNLKI